MIGTTAAILGSAAIGGGTSLLGGLFGGSAAKKAAKIQAQAAKEQAARLQAILDQYNPKIGEAAEGAATGATAAGERAIEDVRAAARAAGIDVRGAYAGANEFLSPYIHGGEQSLAQFMALTAPGGELNRTPNAQEVLAQDPGYQFRMEQASKALQASAAAKGGALGGGTLSALMGLNQNLASSEYGAAFERLRESQQDRAARLSTLMNLGYDAAGRYGQNLTAGEQFLASLGMNAATTTGQFGTNAAQFAGSTRLNAAENQAQNALGMGRSIADLMTGGAAAQAAGTVGAANAWQGAFSGIGNAAIGAGNLITQQNTLDRIFGSRAVTPGDVTSIPTPQIWANPALMPGYGVVR